MSHIIIGNEDIFYLFTYLSGVYATYICLKDLQVSKPIFLLALGSWLAFICYQIACCYNDDFDKQ